MKKRAIMQIKHAKMLHQSLLKNIRNYNHCASLESGILLYAWDRKLIYVINAYHMCHVIINIAVKPDDVPLYALTYVFICV